MHFCLMLEAEDREFIVAALRENGRLLQHTSAELRRDPVVVLEAVRSWGPALEFAGDELRHDREFALQVMLGFAAD
jgi:hypothetical protein